jgi:hypothetical protein
MLSIRLVLLVEAQPFLAAGSLIFRTEPESFFRQGQRLLEVSHFGIRRGQRVKARPGIRGRQLAGLVGVFECPLAVSVGVVWTGGEQPGQTVVGL